MEIGHEVLEGETAGKEGKLQELYQAAFLC